MCNLNCSFCSNDNLIKREMTLEEFECVLKKIDSYTDYIYLHVKGEPLLHSKFRAILNLCKKYNKKVNITTNGKLLYKNLDNIIDSNIRQINISLQSLADDTYLDDILKSVEELLKTNIQIVLRFWALPDNKLNDFQIKVVAKIFKYFNLKDIDLRFNNIKLLNNLYLNKDTLFTWPDLDNKFITDKGTCYGLRTQLAILVDGTVIPCCLDSKGVINLGNIYETDLKSILDTVLVQNIVTNFQNNKLCLELCTKCDYINRFK